jgi:carboxymethylenebutenolidase
METINQEIALKGHDGAEIHAFLSQPRNSRADTPAVIVIHEIWGLNNQIRQVAIRYAGAGFIALAPNLFSRDSSLLTEDNIERVMRKLWSVPQAKRSDPSVLAELNKGMDDQERRTLDLLYFNRQKLNENMVKDVGVLREALVRGAGTPAVEEKRIGITGFCMGGGISFQAATVFPFRATAVFYGMNPTPVDSVEHISGDVLALYAGEDQAVNAGVPAVVEAMFKYGKNFEMKIYKGAQHAFFNEERPSYNREAAEDAWARVVGFFRKSLAGVVS